MIGDNIKEARKGKGLSQRQLADRIRAAGRIDGLDYTAVHRIETGKRKVASHELAELAEVLETSTGRLLGGGDRSPALALAMRVTAEVTPGTLDGARQRAVEILEAADLLARLIGPLPTTTPPELGPVPNTRGAGKALAERVRVALDLGSAPIADLAMIVETAFGAHVSHEPLDAGTHGFCVAGEGASVIIVNSNDVYGRQRFTLAHELCHLIANDLDTYEVIDGGSGGRRSSEGRADEFAAHFLAPDAGIRQLAAGSVDAIGAIHLVHAFGMSLEAMLIRLQNLRLISTAAAQEASKEGPARLSMLAGLSDDYRDQQDKVGRIVPPGRLTEQAAAAFEKGEIGVGLLSAVVGERNLDRSRASLGSSEEGFGDQSHLA